MKKQEIISKRYVSPNGGRNYYGYDEYAMISELRRSRRYNDFLPVTVIAVNGIKAAIESVPFSARVINISRHGACLLMSRVMAKQYHIFETTRENDSFFLKLKRVVAQNRQSFTVPARPIWMKAFDLDDIHVFRLGIEFIINPDGAQMDGIMETVSRK